MGRIGALLTAECLELGKLPVEWYLGRMGIRRSDQVVRMARGAAAVAACLVLANCASSGKFASRLDPKYGVSSSPRVVAFGDPVPKGGGTYRVGKPYTVAGRVYVPEEDVNYREEGLASWYGDDFHGRLTANGEVFDMGSLTAAHPTLPMPCYARVTNLSNGKSLIVRVNDRGPYHGNRLIDVSNRAAELLEFKGNGVARVRVEYVGRAPLEGSDDRQLMATLAHRRTGAVAVAGPGGVRSSLRSGNSGPAARSAATFRCRRGGPIASAIRPAIRPRSTRHRRFLLRPRRVPRVAFSKIRARCLTKTTLGMRSPSVRSPPMRRSTRVVRANCWPDAGSTEPADASSCRVLLQRTDQGGIDLVGALLLNPVAGALDDQLCLRFGRTRSMSPTRLAPIKPVMTESLDPAMNSDG